MPGKSEVINKHSNVLKTLDEVFPLLSDEDKKIAESFHDLINELDMKISINLNINAANTKKNYVISYSTKKPITRNLFSFKISVSDNDEKPTFILKANLFDFDAYRPIVESCPDSIKDVIKSTGSCKKCVLQRGKGVCQVMEKTYMLDGVLYDPCQYLGHIFEKFIENEWESLRNLVIEEYKFCTAV